MGELTLIVGSVPDDFVFEYNGLRYGPRYETVFRYYDACDALGFVAAYETEVQRRGITNVVALDGPTMDDLGQSLLDRGRRRPSRLSRRDHRHVPKPAGRDSGQHRHRLAPCGDR